MATLVDVEWKMSDLRILKRKEMGLPPFKVLTFQTLMFPKCKAIMNLRKLLRTVEEGDNTFIRIPQIILSMRHTNLLSITKIIATSIQIPN